ncbi:hypothetical protein F2Q68_00009292 [Brassica cretica]|uniref:Uncharacterized protein n=1 Tax=Brassica cretica TaxID=69181 RepID=A0A8S9L1Z2_BRACR|nr:hypothetical protein F2Q68_00009292 [Brassica cretica]
MLSHTQEVLVLCSAARVYDCVVCSKLSSMASCGQYVRRFTSIIFFTAFVLAIPSSGQPNTWFCLEDSLLDLSPLTPEGALHFGFWLLVLKGHLRRGCARESFTPRCLHLVTGGSERLFDLGCGSKRRWRYIQADLGGICKALCSLLRRRQGNSRHPRQQGEPHILESYVDG